MLKEGDIFTLSQLYYALMLPSGNDAAFLIADYFGEYLYNERYNELNESYVQTI
jgi:D-alanyl-D-alanine carboxypeptidase